VVFRIVFFLIFAWSFSLPAHAKWCPDFLQRIAASFPSAPEEFKIPYQDALDRWNTKSQRQVADFAEDVDTSSLKVLDEAERAMAEEKLLSEAVRREVTQMSLLDERIQLNANPNWLSSGIKGLNHEFRNWWEIYGRDYASERALREHGQAETSFFDLYQRAKTDYLKQMKPRFMERFRMPPFVRRGVEIVATSIKKPVVWVATILMYSTFLAVGPQIGHKLTAPVSAEFDRLTSTFTASYQVRFSKMVNGLDKKSSETRLTEAASGMLAILRDSSSMQPQDVAKALDGFNSMYAESRVLTPAAVRSDQNEGRNLVHWVGVNFPMDFTMRLAGLDDIVQRDRDALLANQVVLDDIQRHHPAVMSADSEAALKSDDEKRFYRTRMDVEKRQEELKAHMLVTKKRMGGVLVSWQVTEFMFGELFYAKGESSAGNMYRRFQAQYEMLDFVRGYDKEFEAAIKDLKYYFDKGKIKEQLFVHLPPTLQQKLVIEDAQLREAGKSELSTFENDDRARLYRAAFSGANEIVPTGGQ
jgi:hypothetical protein